jgi:predicted RNA-binding Zn-ribbon protein involved in translation (DUF1610 family)
VPIKVSCSCGKTLTAPDTAAGKKAKCPSCGQVIVVPAAVQETEPVGIAAAGPPGVPPAQTSGPPSPAAEGETRQPCPECGEMIVKGAAKCHFCNAIFDPRLKVNVATDSGVETLIPYKNARALWAYYLGVFALIPCFGIPLGIAALVLGIKGLKYARLHPEAKGKAHAWVGIVLGGICSAGYVLLIVVFVIGITMRTGTMHHR